MKKPQIITDLKGKAKVSLLALGALLLSQTTLAHNRVVVIPVAGDDIPAPAPETFTNRFGMQFNTLPAGSFTMGSPSDEPGLDSDEVEHTVTLAKSFAMQTTEVTNAQWDAVMISTFGGSLPSQSNAGYNYPVETVSWYDAIAFANTLSSIDPIPRTSCYTISGASGTPGQAGFTFTSATPVPDCTGYRLPTEAEWEYAARAGTTKAYANPSDFDDSQTETSGGLNTNLDTMGWYRYNNDLVSGYGSGTKPVANKQANAWGLYDMHGNVWEWSWDWYAAYSGNATDPLGPASGSSRVLRGGRWNGNASDARSANRFSVPPSTRLDSMGFRLVLLQVQ